MLNIRKSALAILLITSLFVGAAGGALVMNGGLGILPITRNSSRVEISRQQYDEYVHYKSVYGKVDSIRKHIMAVYYSDIDPEALEDGMCRGLMSGLGDDYSEYMTAEEYEEVMLDLSGEYSGLGIYMTTNEEGDIELDPINEDSPAFKAGVETGDILVSVEGIKYSGKEIDEAARAIRGKEGTKVTLVVERDGENIEFEVKRKTIHLESIYFEMLEEDIGYIGIVAFETQTGKDFKNALKKLEKDGASGLIIDLRGNPGGVVDVAVDVADALMDRGTVVYTEDSAGNRDFYKTADGSTSLPFVLLVDENSASASEILAAGIKDNGVAKIVGKKTYGKGVIQQMDRLPDGSAVQMTVMQYFSPSGNAIHGEGVTPDYEVENPPLVRGEEFEDLQLEKAIEVLRGEMDRS